MSRKRERDTSHDSDFEDFRDPGEQFFAQFVHAAMNGQTSMESLVKTCQKYGKKHGELLRRKEEDTKSYSKVYSSSTHSRRQNRSVAETSVDLLNPAETSASNPYSHPFYQIFHGGKNPAAQSLAEASAVANGKSGRAISRAVSEPVPQRRTQPVSGLKGVEEYLQNGIVVPNKFSAEVSVLGRRVDLGDFAREREAAVAHDRALLRALGPAACSVEQLNFPIASYAKDSLECFERFDSILKRSLQSVAAWTGPKDCDFAFLLTQLMKTPIPKKKPPSALNLPVAVTLSAEKRAQSLPVSVSSSSVKQSQTPTEVSASPTKNDDSSGIYF